jgi:hypothetical protein
VLMMVGSAHGMMSFISQSSALDFDHDGRYALAPAVAVLAGR